MSTEHERFTFSKDNTLKQAIQTRRRALGWIMKVAGGVGLAGLGLGINPLKALADCCTCVGNPVNLGCSVDSCTCCSCSSKCYVTTCQYDVTCPGEFGCGYHFCRNTYVSKCGCVSC